MIKRLCAILAALVACVATPALAQQTPVVFVHGFNSSGGTWQDAAAHFSNQLAIQPHVPTLDWKRPYGEQAATLQNSYAGLPNNTIAIGHSNGGLISRQWSRSHDLAGIVTVGSPHRGAPLAANGPLLLSYFGNLIHVANASLAQLDFIASRQPAGDWWWVIQQAADVVYWSTSIGSWLMDEFAGDLAHFVESRVPVLRDMKPGSDFLVDLNSNANLSREASALPVRIGIVSMTSTYGLPWRAIAPENADWLAAFTRVVAWNMAMAGLNAMFVADPEDPKSFDIGWGFFETANMLWNLDEFWCRAVSSVGAWIPCQPSDAVVPAYSQEYPGGLNIYVPGYGPAHSEETDHVNEWLEVALVNHLHVPPFGSVPTPPPPPGPVPPPPPPPPPPSGSDMTPGAAIRGCADYSDWGATYKDSPESCSAYCAANGADACEWEESSGGCWVEFGTGCYVEGGYGGWWAATMHGEVRSAVPAATNSVAPPPSSSSMPTRWGSVAAAAVPLAMLARRPWPFTRKRRWWLRAVA